MLGARFLDADFMRINLACEASSVQLIHLFCTVVKGGGAAWGASRSQCRMEAPGRVRGMRGQHEPRGYCLAAEPLWGPPGRGDFLVSNFHPSLILGNLALRFLMVREVAGAVSGVACFGLPPWKKFSAA